MSVTTDRKCSRWLAGCIPVFLIVGGPLSGQGQAPPAPSSAPTPGSASPRVADVNPGGRDPSYEIGAKDVLAIQASEMEEIGTAPYVVDGNGEIVLPMLGPVKAAGLTLGQLEAVLVERLNRYVKRPTVVVSVLKMHSEPIFFNGAFKNPGIYNLQGRRTLIETISSIGGLQPNARHRLKVTRRTEWGQIPLPNAVQDSNAGLSVLEVNLNSLQQPFDPAHDIELRPYDTVAVEHSEMIYVAGEFGKVGGFELQDRESLTVVQLVALAGGLGNNASPEHARILRPVLETSQRAEIPVNIKDILAGKSNDIPLLANDMLYVPASRSKAIVSRVVQLTAPLAAPLILIGTR